MQFRELTATLTDQITAKRKVLQILVPAPAGMAIPMRVANGSDSLSCCSITFTLPSGHGPSMPQH